MVGGDSPRPLIRYTLDRHLTALRTVLVEQRDCVLVGHSLGAALALAYTARYADDVKGLLFLGLPHFGGRRAALRWMRRHPRNWYLTNMVTTAAGCIVGRRVLGPLLPRLLPNLPRVVAEDLVKRNFLSATASLWNVLYEPDLAVDADAIPDHIPVHVVHGSRDASAPVTNVRALATGRPDWHITELEDVGHQVWLSAPDLCAALVFDLGVGQQAWDGTVEATTG